MSRICKFYFTYRTAAAITLLQMQHDACGVGFIARIGGAAGHDIVRHGVTALVRLAHRGAPASLGFVDGCGILTAIPWTLVADSCDRPLPAGRTRALGMLF